MARNDEFYDGDERGFFKRHPAAVAAGVVVLCALGLLAFKMTSREQLVSMPKKQEIVMITTPRVALPSPTPPAVSTPQPTPEKMIVDPQDDDVAKSTPAASAPPVPPGIISTGIPGNKQSDMNFGPGDGGPSGNGPAISGGRRWGWYASLVRTRIADARRKNPRTRDASIRIQVRIWPDSTGHVTRAQLVDSTGDTATDNAIKNEVLTGLVLDAPPSDMPKPILLRLTASRTN